MVAWKIGPALACGNTVVLKPAEQTPLSALYFATLIVKAGFPPGVVNILNGFGRIAGAAIASHLDIDKISFTGSTATGREVMKSASINQKNITLETGGKSPLLVFDDADLKEAVTWAHRGIMVNMGQVCSATSRILVQEGVYSQFLEAFKKQVKAINIIGDPFEDSTFHGPQITKVQFDRILGYIESGKREGATLALGGEAHKDVNGKGFFVQPTIFTDVKDEMKIYREEIFGPFVVISSFKIEEEALRRANDTTYGLGSSVSLAELLVPGTLRRKLKFVVRSSLKISRRRFVLLGTLKLEWCGSTPATISISGMLFFACSNKAFPLTVLPSIPFGGTKQSGIGRELGEAGLAAYTNLKSVHVNLA